MANSKELNSLGTEYWNKSNLKCMLHFYLKNINLYRSECKEHIFMELFKFILFSTYIYIILIRFTLILAQSMVGGGNLGI